MARTIAILAAGGFLSKGAWGGSPAPQDLLGVWDVQGGESREKWSVESKRDVQIFVRRESGKITLRLTCSPQAGGCAGIDDGKKAHVTMYARGPVLTHWEVRDTNLILRRFVVEGKVMTIEARQLTGRGR